MFINIVKLARQLTSIRIIQNEMNTTQIFFISLGSLRKKIIIGLGLKETLRGQSENACLRREKSFNTKQRFLILIILPKLIKKFIALIIQSSIVITFPDTLFKWPHCFVLMILLFQRLVNLLCKDLIASYEGRRRGWKCLVWSSRKTKHLSLFLSVKLF